MPSIPTAIWLALKGRVQTLAIPGYGQIAYPNETFVKPGPSVGYLRVTWIPNFNRRRSINSNGKHQRYSILQIDVFSPKDQPAAVAIDVAGQIAEHFPADLWMRAHGAAARVRRAPDVMQPIPDDTHLMVTVMIKIEVLA